MGVTRRIPLNIFRMFPSSILLPFLVLLPSLPLYSSLKIVNLSSLIPQIPPILPPPTNSNSNESLQIRREVFWTIQKFTIGSFPNPMVGEGFWHCNLDSPGLICDPNLLLKREDRLEMQEWIGHFPEWTKNPISTNRCIQRGVRLGIALAHSQIDGATLSPLYVNATQRQWRDWLKDGDAQRITDIIWQRLNGLEQNTKDLIGAHLAKEWHLADDRTIFGCHLAVLILVTSEPAEIHIYSDKSIPISPAEKAAIIATHQFFLAITPRDYSHALRAIIGDLSQLISHKLNVLIGENAKAVPIGQNANERKTKNANEKMEPQKGGKGPEKTIGNNADQNLDIFLWLAILLSIFFSISAFLLALFLCIKIHRIGQRRRGRQMPRKGQQAVMNHNNSQMGGRNADLEVDDREKICK